MSKRMERSGDIEFDGADNRGVQSRRVGEGLPKGCQIRWPGQGWGPFFLPTIFSFYRYRDP